MRMPAMLLVLVIVAVVAACTSVMQDPVSGLCSRRGKCPNELPPTSSDSMSCNALLNGTCGPQFKAFLQCGYDKELCTAAGGFDLPGTVALCQSEFDATVACQNVSMDGGADAAATCGPSTCIGCCLNNTCQGGGTTAACGTGGAQCTACAAQQICRTDRSCGVDPESVWKVQPVSAEISATNQGSSWDTGSAPDPFVNLWCPSTAASITSWTPTVNDSFYPKWSTGGCPMKAKDLIATGFALAVWDEDISVNDLIVPKSPLTVTEANLLTGYRDGITNGTTLVTMKVAFQKQ